MALDKRFEWIIFDLGGVLIEITPDRFYQNMSKEINIPVEFIQSYKESMALGYKEPEIIINEFINKYGLNITSDYFIKKFVELYIGKKIDGMFEFVKELKKEGYKIGLLSNTNKLHINYLKHKFSNFKDFDAVFYSYEIHINKPSLDAYRYVLEKLKVEPNKILFIDDTYENIKSAESLGIECIQVRMNHPSIKMIKHRLEDEKA